MIRLSELIAKAEQVRSNANAAFEALSAEQINWRPSAGQWNIAQCLEHLIRPNEPYFPQIDKILSGQRQASLWERVPLLPAFFGRRVLTAVQRSQRRRSKRARRSRLRLCRVRSISVSWSASQRISRI